MRWLMDIIRHSAQFVEQIPNTRFLIEVLDLEAMFHDRQGDEPRALATLAGSLSLAERSGFIRLYIDRGPQIHQLLGRLPQRDTLGAYAAPKRRSNATRSISTKSLA
jgi:hypothetical protein